MIYKTVRPETIAASGSLLALERPNAAALSRRSVIWRPCIIISHESCYVDRTAIAAVIHSW